jgi:hypothetical protein
VVRIAGEGGTALGPGSSSYRAAESPSVAARPGRMSGHDGSPTQCSWPGCQRLVQEAVLDVRCHMCERRRCCSTTSSTALSDPASPVAKVNSPRRAHVCAGKRLASLLHVCTPERTAVKACVPSQLDMECGVKGGGKNETTR